jgi:hypothetical protein
MGASISIIVFSMSCQALLDIPLDPPGTILVSNRYVRFASRFVYIVVIMTVPIKIDITVPLYLGICGVGLSLVIWYEWIVSLEQPAKIVEPKGLVTLIKQTSR